MVSLCSRSLAGWSFYYSLFYSFYSLSAFSDAFLIKALTSFFSFFISFFFYSSAIFYFFVTVFYFFSTYFYPLYLFILFPSSFAGFTSFLT